MTPVCSEPSAADAAATVDYIIDMTAGLARMSGDAKLLMVTYFLNLARVEAEACRRTYRR